MAARAQTASRSASQIRSFSATVTAIPQRLRPTAFTILIPRRERSTSTRAAPNGSNAVGRRRCGIAVTVAEKDLICEAERLAVWARAAMDGLMVIVTHGVGVSERLEKRSVAILNVEEGHGLTGVMRRASRWRAEGCGDRGLEIVETPGRVVL